MPEGYDGPIAFQSDWASGEDSYRPSKTKNPDLWAALGTFTLQSSGVATPESDGSVSITYKTSIYDYYNWNPDDQLTSGLNELHKAGMAQNFETFGTTGNVYATNAPK
ncbi:hypothetical protein GOARA_036_00010 [Gordonia araii NBRC 100433]|uniref:Uncharacterized protein n=1 Tax=Gordonia araii NBRC 100433 TaxID=1073574 RepID=G7H094_9ACTN|nr:hypothetical protein GOARA_036_00010 [Gordonia araii NBRC 100433]